MDQTNDDEIEDNDPPDYRVPEDVAPSEISTALSSLFSLGADPYLSTQIYGIAIVDQFIMGLEYDVMREQFATERTPPALNHPLIPLPR